MSIPPFIPSRPQNPEAGPSDTVPAMLTPGEAVIPASAAQDPDNIPAIQRMVAEGRMKNRMAEANGVPVNGKEAIMYDEKKLGFAGGNMNIPQGMHMMPDGTLMRDEDHMGYEHGATSVSVMAVPSMEIPPVVEGMNELALKQMGYEIESKNRTRATIEKIGRKHLEDTADANMKQAALDETMRNYNMPVPMPMQAVPSMQGFQQGTGKATVTNPEGFTKEELYADRPNLTGGQMFKTSFGGSAVIPRLEDMSDAELMEIIRFGETVPKQDAAQKIYNLRRQESGTPTAQNNNLITQPPAPPAPSATPASGINNNSLTLDDISIISPDGSSTNTNKNTGDKDDDNKGSSFLSNLGTSLMEGIKTGLDPETLAKTLITYGLTAELNQSRAKGAEAATGVYLDALENAGETSAFAGAGKPTGTFIYDTLTGERLNVISFGDNQAGVLIGDDILPYTAVVNNDRYVDYQPDYHDRNKVADSITKDLEATVAALNSENPGQDPIVIDSTGIGNTLQDIIRTDFIRLGIDPATNNALRMVSNTAAKKFYDDKVKYREDPKDERFGGGAPTFREYYNAEKLTLMVRNPRTGEISLNSSDIGNASAYRVAKMVKAIEKRFGINKTEPTYYENLYNIFDNLKQRYNALPSNKLETLDIGKGYSPFVFFVESMANEDESVKRDLGIK